MIVLGTSPPNPGHAPCCYEPPMKSALFVATVASLATGCIIHDGSRDDRGYDAAAIEARWSLRDLATDRATACPAGFTTAQLNTQLVDERGNPLDRVITDLFDCADGYGVTDLLVADRQLVWLEIRSDDGSRLYASSTSAIVDLYNGSATFDAQILNDGGYFQLDWNLVGKQSNRPLQCSDVIGGVDAIEGISTSVANGREAIVDTFVCEDHVGISGGLLAGDYTISLDAQAGNKSVGTAAPVSKRILDKNQVTDLGSITIPIEGQ